MLSRIINIRRKIIIIAIKIIILSIIMKKPKEIKQYTKV
jgi:hypothetical protein